MDEFPIFERQDIVCEKYNIALTGSDFQTLLTGRKLTDNIIHFYGNHLRETIEPNYLPIDPLLFPLNSKKAPSFLRKKVQFHSH